MDRRQFLKGGAVAAAGAFGLSMLAGCSPQTSASSEEQAASEEWYGSAQDPSAFDVVETLDTDVLVCGFGAGGIVATAFAAQQGMDVTVVEKGGGHGSIKTYYGCIGARDDERNGVKLDKMAVVNEFLRYTNGWCNPRLAKMWADESGATYDWICNVVAEFGATPYFETDDGGGHHGIWPVYPISHGWHYTYTEEELAKAQQAVEESGDPAAGTQSLPSVATYIVKKAEEWGANILYQHALVQLAQDESGKVTGAYVETSDGYKLINAKKGVILATGGYEADSDLLARLNPDSAAIGALSMTQAGCVGDGIKAGIWAGGVKDAIPTLMTFARAAVAPGDSLGAPYVGTTCWMGDQPFMKVNLDGKRVCCETSPYDYPLFVASQQRECKLASIWDANYEEHIKVFHTLGCSRIDPSATVDADGVATGEGLTFEVNATMIAAAKEAGIIQEADTIEGLAEKLGIDPQGLSESVERYNELCAAGADEDFGKDSKDLLPIDTPPYTGAFFGGHVLCTLDGLRVDEEMRVLNAEQQPIEGLYAVGNCSGNLFAGSYPELFIGIANGRTTTQARHVILNLLEA